MTQQGRTTVRCHGRELRRRCQRTASRSGPRHPDTRKPRQLPGPVRLPEFAHLKLWKWAHMLGFRGHFSTKSRSYSTTLGMLRDARRAWRTEPARAHAVLPEPGPGTTLVVGHWAHQGSGYSPGGALLAAAVWHRRELARQFAAEGGC
ncbi:replication initiator [Streptomyces sp. NPDC019922]|uniref:replication initiator n=1 Tax=Streptomyces sp. NPDC019922 TaxID=3156662 RepID=UPI0033E08D2C